MSTTHPYGRISRAEAERMSAALAPRDRQGHMRAALRLLSDPLPVRASRDDGDAEFDAEYSHLWAPRTPAEAERQARRRQKIAASYAHDPGDDDANYAAIFGEDGPS